MQQVKGSSIIRFQEKPIKNPKTYALYRAFKNGQELYAKVFNDKIVAKYNLDETLEFNIETLTESPNFYYHQNFLHIDATYNQGQAIIFVTKPYQIRLDQYIKGSPKPQKQALAIMQQLLKAGYTLIMQGFWHRNLRAEHFVKVGDKWKLQSIVFEQKINQQGFNSQYIYNSMYQPPQAYDRDNFTEQQLTQRMVWDLGCILVHILTGFHKLKQKSILNKFKDCPFSFKKIGAAALQTQLSHQTKQILGKMCHFNQKQRMTNDQLILSGYFSKQVAEHYKKYKQNRKKSIFIGSSGSISQSQSLHTKKSKTLKVQQQKLKNIVENLRLSDKKEQQNLRSSSNPGQRLETKQKFKVTISSIIQEQKEQLSSMLKRNNLQSNPIQKMPSLDQIKNDQFNDILQVYKNYLDKGQLLGIGGLKFQQMLQLFQDKKLGKQLGDLTQYALNFVKAMQFCKLAKSMNENKSLFQLSGKSWQKFHGSSQYNSLKKIVNFKKKQALKQVFQLRQKVMNSTNRFRNQKIAIKNFVTSSKPQQSQFVDIKLPYRKILKLSYDMIADRYTTHKTVEWARLGMYITYCLAIDKFYLPEHFQTNFKYFFKWSRKQPSNYVSQYDFQQYLDHAPRPDLVQNSRYIMQTFFQI